MCTQELKIGTIPAVLYGKPAPNIWLFVHGQGGNSICGACRPNRLAGVGH